METSIRQFITENNLGPEVLGIHKEYTTKQILDAYNNKDIIEVTVIRCSEDLDLTVALNSNCRGIINFEDTMIEKEGKIKRFSVLHLVGKTVKCIIKSLEQSEDGTLCNIELSRREAQERFKTNVLDKIKPGAILEGTVVGCEKYGVFVDIGCGTVGLLRAELISISRIQEEEIKTIFNIGDKIPVIIKDIINGRITLSYKELLGTMEENLKAYEIYPRTTVVGKVRNKLDFGIFVELAPNLNGLMKYRDDINVGDTVTVFVTTVNLEKSKIRLLLVSNVDASQYKNNFKNILLDPLPDRIQHWRYSSEESVKVTETIFGEEFTDKK